MKKKYVLLVLAIIFSANLFAQKKYNVIVYTNEGENFWLTLNGIKQNEEASTNVKVTDLKAQNYAVKVIFENQQEPLEKTLWLPENSSEITYRIKKKRNGKLVMRLFSAVPIQESVIQKEDKSVVKYTPVERTPSSNTVSVTTTTKTVTAGGSKKKGNGKSGSISVNIGDNSFGLNVNVNDGEDEDESSEEITITKTVTTTTTSEPEEIGVVYVEEDSCQPIETGDFNRAKQSISSKTFSDTKLRVAKQIIDNNCFNAGQVKSLMSLFTFEDEKLDIAKYAYNKTTDKENYYKVNDAFEFEMTIGDLQDYIKTQE
ncbi:DUF4476 domain-containing protein [Aureivirga sp. CE67]|uniref:DUF4476 domain-containing protein n=1 Tax=Aureivirga sp. CE67 TaxID=1788983 RepID=UPI0018CACD49|nr:DUF4476 domain-containing protein [Aureivirga sp. CE67]